MRAEASTLMPTSMDQPRRKVTQKFHHLIRPYHAKFKRLGSPHSVNNVGYL